MPLSSRSLLRACIPCFALALAAIFFIIHKVHLQSVEKVLQTMHVKWFLVALMLFGFLFLPAAVRWHVALKANRSAVNLSTSLRLSLIGHFFYMVLFGVAGGDATKSALYARWNRLPVLGILAASSLDRLLGFLGLVIFTTFAFTLAAIHGGLTKAASLPIRWPGRWWLLLVPIVIAVLVLVGRSSRKSLLYQFLRKFGGSVRQLIRSPGHLLVGIISAVLVQAALSGVLAVCLQAVSREPIAWLQLAWTFPIISVVSALPITVAGVGVRDSAAMVLLGWYHVPMANAVAASLLTAFISLAWMTMGAAVLWREAVRREPAFRLKSFSSLIARLKGSVA